MSILKSPGSSSSGGGDTGKFIVQKALAEAFNSDTCLWALRQNKLGFIIDDYLQTNSKDLSSLDTFDDICNSTPSISLILKSELYEKIIKYLDWAMAKVMAGFSGEAAKFENLTAVANSQTAMTAVINSQTAMTAVINSQTAMTAVINSQTAMTAVANSQTAMTAVANSQTAMTAVINSQTAIAGISKVSDTNTLLNWLKKVNETQSYITAIANTMKASTLFTNSYNGGHDGVTAADAYFKSGNIIGLCCCGYYSSSSQSVNMLLNGTSVFTGKTGYNRPTTGSTNTNAIAIRGCTFTETSDAYLGISVYTLK